MYDILQGNILSNVIHKMMQIQFIINHMLLQVERDIFFMYGSMNKMITVLKLISSPDLAQMLCEDKSDKVLIHRTSSITCRFWLIRRWSPWQYEMNSIRTEAMYMVFH